MPKSRNTSGKAQNGCMMLQARLETSLSSGTSKVQPVSGCGMGFSPFRPLSFRLCPQVDRVLQVFHMVVQTVFHLCSVCQAERPSLERTGFKILSSQQRGPATRAATSVYRCRKARSELHKVSSPCGELVPAPAHQRCNRSPAALECDSATSHLVSVLPFCSSAGRSLGSPVYSMSLSGLSGAQPAKE